MVFVLALSLVACGGKAETSTKGETSTNENIDKTSSSSSAPDVLNSARTTNTEGTVLCLFGEKTTGSEVIFKVDGVEVKKLISGYEKQREIMGVDNLNPGRHTVEIIVSRKGIRLDALIIG